MEKVGFLGICTIVLLAVVLLLAPSATASMVLAFEAADGMMAEVRHSSPQHDPRLLDSEAEEKINRMWRDIQLKLSDPTSGPKIMCAVAIYQNGVAYVRILNSETGDMAWFGTEGWSGAFGGKDVEGFLGGRPRGALEYKTGIPLLDCLSYLGKIPSPNEVKP